MECDCAPVWFQTILALSVILTVLAVGVLCKK